MGIVRTKPTPLANPKPTASTVAKINSQVTIKFVKAGFQGVRIESRRGAETGWTMLTNALRSPFTDARPPLVAGQPEVRQYRVLFLSGNDTVGEPSDTVQVSTIP